MSLATMLFSFEGRLRRSHWWVIRLVSTVGFLALLAIPFGVVNAIWPTPPSQSLEGVAGVVLVVIGLPSVAAYVWMYLATSVKRLHDQNLTGWITPLFFVPYVGGLAALVVLGFIDGTKGPNRFGPSEKYPESVAETFA